MLKVISIMCCAIALLAVPTGAVAGTPTFCFIGLGLQSSSESESSQDSAAISASSGVGAARDELHRLAIALSRQFESSSDYQAAKLAALQTLSAYELAKEDVLARVEQSPEGVAAQIEIDRLERQLDEARSQAKLAGLDRSDKIDGLAISLLNQRSAVSHRNAGALAADEKLAGFRYAWLDANARLAELRANFAQQLHYDPQWRGAKAQLEQARTALASISR